jgi:hypothetical protein
MIKQQLLPDVEILQIMDLKLSVIGQSDTLYLVISLIRQRTEAGKKNFANHEFTKVLYSLISKIDTEHILDQNKILF